MDQPKRRGRPPGSRNKSALERDIKTPPALDPYRPRDDYKHGDPDTIVARQLSMLDWAQQAVRNEMQSAYQSQGVSFQLKDVEKLEKLSNAIVRAIQALKQSSDLADELAARLTPEQLLNAALKKIEAQDLPTIKDAIKRLRAHLASLTPVTYQDRQHMGEITATGAIASLAEDE